MVSIKVLAICLLYFDIKESYELDSCFTRVLRKSRWFTDQIVNIEVSSP